jgi:acyl carrier protein|tara:strand:+ start:240 stop:491 length:252 start_codon:yes stop_codon:yes gene_type:complete
MTENYKKYLLMWFKKKRINLNEKTDLFSCRNLDSFGFIKLLIDIETKYNIKLEHETIFLKKKLTLFDLSLIIKKNENKKIKKK